VTRPPTFEPNQFVFFARLAFVPIQFKKVVTSPDRTKSLRWTTIIPKIKDNEKNQTARSKPAIIEKTKITKRNYVSENLKKALENPN